MENEKTVDINGFVQKAIKNMYVSILNTTEDIFIEEIKGNDEKWNRLRGRILSIGNDTLRSLVNVLEHCTVQSKRQKITFVNVDDKLVRVDN